MDNRWTYSRTMAVRSGELAPSAKALAAALRPYKKEAISARQQRQGSQADPFQKSPRVEQKLSTKTKRKR